MRNHASWRVSNTWNSKEGSPRAGVSGNPVTVACSGRRRQVSEGCAAAVKGDRSVAYTSEGMSVLCVECDDRT